MTAASNRIYEIPIQIAFDPEKDAVNRIKHGLSLSEAADFNFEMAVVTEDRRFDNGEVRFRAFAYVKGQGRCLVFTAIAATIIRAVSYRRAQDKEMTRYGLHPPAA